MSGVKLSSKLPDPDRSGMDKLHGRLVRTPEARHVIVAVVDCVSTNVIHGPDGDSYVPTAGVIFVEPIDDPEDVQTIIDVMGRVRAERMDDGGSLDFDFGVGGASDFLKHGVGLHTTGS